MEFKDLFSENPALYSKFRPVYPAALYSHLATLTARHELAWDCGTGNGQAAVELAAFYSSVVATDPSEKQLAEARAHPRVSYSRARAEASGIASDTVDLITVAQAFHWFDHPKFFEEARRVGSKAGSVLAVWSYALLKIRPDLDGIIRHFYDVTVGPYWEPERQHVDEGYSRVTFPFPEIALPRFEMTAEWDLEHFFGYLATWSATRAAARALKVDPLVALRAELEPLWPADKTMPMRFDFMARAFRVH